MACFYHTWPHLKFFVFCFNCGMARLGLYFKKEKNLTGSVLQNGSHWIKSENKKVVWVSY